MMMRTRIHLQLNGLVVTSAYSGSISLEYKVFPILACIVSTNNSKVVYILCHIIFKLCLIFAVGFTLLLDFNFAQFTKAILLCYKKDKRSFQK